jgi:polyisoprenoid-binding protein YceI
MLKSSVLALALFATACSGPTEPKATVGTPASTTSQAASAPASTATTAPVAANKESLALSPESKVAFVGAKITASHDGAFTQFTGSIDLVDGKPEGSAVNIEIDMNSLVIEPAKLAGHLKTADFFDVEKFPKTTFASTGVSPGGAGGATHTVTGNLTLHGVTKAISFPAMITVSQLGVDATADFVINRKDFGVVYPGMPDDLIKDDVVIKLALKAPRKV